MKNEIIKYFLICAFIIGSVQCLNAQDLKANFKKAQDDLIARTHERLDLNEEPCAVVRVSAANIYTYSFEGNIIGDVVYEAGEALVYMSEGSRYITIKSNQFGMMTVDFPYKLEKRMAYKLDLKIILAEDQKTRTLVMPVIGLGETTSYGAMVGVVKKTGVYAKVKYNFLSFSKDYECNNQGVIAGTDNYNSWFTGENKIARFAVTAGLLQRLWKPAYLYVGAGYGYKRLGWELDSGEWAENSDKTYKGIEAEIGGIYRIKNFALSVGVQTNSFKYWEATVGLGIMF